MRRTVYVVLLAVLFSFLFGVWWGFKPSDPNLAWFSKKQSLRVLAPKGLVTPDFVTQLQKQKGLNLHLTEIPTAYKLLRELLKANQEYDIVLFSSFLSDSLILDHYFSEIDPNELDLDQQVSVDFLELEFDPSNRFTVPLLWGVNGWLVPKDKATEKLVLKDQESFQALQDPAELFGIATKLMPVVRSWVETGETKQLLENQTFFKRFNSEKGLKQISSGALSEELLKTNVFRLAQERSHLWIIHGAVAKDTPHQALAREGLRLLLTPEWSQMLASQAQAATVNKNLDASDQLPAYRKASYIRRLPLRQIELFSSHEAYEPIFMSILQRANPSVFN